MNKARRRYNSSLQTRYQPYVEFSAGDAFDLEQFQTGGVVSTVSRPTEDAAIERLVTLERIQKVIDINYRIRRWGCVRLTEREREVLRLSQRMVEYKIPASERRRYLCTEMNSSARNVYYTLRRATMVIKYLEMFDGGFSWQEAGLRGWSPE